MNGGGEFLVGSLLLAMSVVWTLALWGSHLASGPRELALTAQGIRVSFTEGPDKFVGWLDHASPVFLLDLRTSTKSYKTQNEFDDPRVFLYSRALGHPIPLTVSASDCLLGIAEAAGLKLNPSPSGRPDSLPFGVQILLPLRTNVMRLAR